MRRYVVRRAAPVTRDFAAIGKHRVSAYEEFGDTRDAATKRTTARLREAFAYMQGFASHPHRGTIHRELPGGIRHVTDRNFVFYFEVDDRRGEVKFLAVFFGGAFHLRQIAERLAH